MPAEPAVLPRPRPGPPPDARVPAAERWTLPNGLRVAAALRPGVPHLALRLIVPAGSAADPAAHPGAASLVAALLTEGTRHRDAAALHERLDALGASVDASAGHDFAEVRASFLAGTVAEGLALLAEIVAAPAFPADELERIRAETLDALQARRDEPANVADDRFAAELFGPDHPYGRPTWGTEEAVAALPRAALLAFHSERFRPGGSVLIAAGDPGEVDFAATLTEAFAPWSGTAPPRPHLAAPRPSRAPVHLAWPDAHQAEIRLGSPGLARASADWIAAAVANHILGGSTITGRLGANLREARGWTYGVRSGFAAGAGAAGWTAETAVDVEVATAAVREMRREMGRLTREPVPPEELERARDALVLSLPRAFETPARVASRFATAEAYGLAPDYWERFRERVGAVTAADVLRIAREHFAPDRLTEVVVGAGDA